MKLFGREPAAIVALIEAGLVLAIAAGFDLSNDQLGLLMGAATAALGLIVAWRTHDTTLGAVTGFAKAVLALLVGFGSSLSPELTGAIIAFITVAFGFWNRTQTSPVVDAPALRAAA